MTAIAVLGAGSWGVALTHQLRKMQHQVLLWEFDAAIAKVIAEDRQLKFKLPGVLIDNSVVVTNQLDAALSDVELVVLAVPACAMRSTCQQVQGIKAPLAHKYVSVAKGLEVGTRKRMSEVVEEELGSNAGFCVAALSGPSHAEEVGRELPTTITVASSDKGFAEQVREIFMNPAFRVYTSQDVVGVEIGGVIKNAIAIAAGISDGLGFGDNTKAALVTRGLAEITRLGIAMGGKPETFAGLSGLGDLVVTCCSVHSRNYRLGRLLAEGKSLQVAQDAIGMAIEGVNTARSVSALCESYNVEMPIASQVAAVLFENKPPRQAVSELMLREPKNEVERN
jgi:glycerol-3-phosphate dehydrogenase (NAD(P)+)